MFRAPLASRIALCSGLALVSCGELEILGTCPSPDGLSVATFFREYGGGAAGWQSMGVQVQRAREKFSARGAPFEFAHAYQVQLHWASDSHLEIRFPSDASIARNDPAAGSISIAYRGEPPFRGGTLSDSELKLCVE